MKALGAGAPTKFLAVAYYDLRQTLIPGTYSIPAPCAYHHGILYAIWQRMQL